ncbi:MAG: acyl-CoA/acyl-ACP dehydrogenase [Mycobacterium sp.]|nr:acyl-CoA/acyl-ACP dehydrogenase [Mycobacterium sp.]
MDFTRTEAAQDLSQLVGTIVDAVCTPQRQRELDGLGQRFDEELWSTLRDAGVLGAAVPEALGGAGFGVLEQTAVLTALGRQLAAVPYLESVVLGAGAMDRSAAGGLRQDWGVPAIAGEKVLTVALDGETGQGPVRAASSDRGFLLTGARTQVPFGPIADAFLVPSETDTGIKIFLVAADDPGVEVTALETTGLNSSGELRLSEVNLGADRLVGDAQLLSWLATRRALGLAAFQLGVLERALELTAEYARTREQFDRPIGTFQAVSQRLADAYIDLKGLRLSCTQAAWRVSEELPAGVEVATAAFWAAEAGHRVAHTTVHVHGGVGIDVDHPVHRYFITAKQIEFSLGGATAALRAIGRELAETPA